jgi:hypothetical protein
MKTGFRFVVAAAVLAAACGGAQAQRAFHHVNSGSVASTPHAAQVVRLSPSRHNQIAGGVTATTLGGTTTGFDNFFGFGGGSAMTVQQLLNPAPGFGFDYTHLAAVNQNLDVRALIDPITQLRLRQAERLARETPFVSPIFFPAFDSGEPVVLEQPQQQQPPQVIIVQQPVAVQPAPLADAEERAPAVPQAPLPDAGEFILVLRSGSQISAVAFTQQDNRIVYITRQGVRRAVPLDQLDTAETVRINEERGTPLQLPL